MMMINTRVESWVEGCMDEYEGFWRAQEDILPAESQATLGLPQLRRSTSVAKGFCGWSSVQQPLLPCWWLSCRSSLQLVLLGSVKEQQLCNVVLNDAC